jgi:SecD/SecF fusion protein
MVTTAYLINEDADEKVQAATMAGLSDFQDAKPSIVQSTKVGPTVAKDIKESAQLSVMFSLIVMFLYIFIRFQRWQFGLGGLAGLMFNVLVVLGIFSVLGQIDSLPFSAEIDLAFIAAILTIVGYTINDTVIVFDRIRERVREDKSRKSLSELFNMAVNETLSRTIITSGTTLLSAFILFLFAGEVLQAFMLAMILGIIVGTLSSIFIASPISLDLILRTARKEEAKTKEKAAVAAR